MTPNFILLTSLTTTKESIDVLLRILSKEKNDPKLANLLFCKYTVRYFQLIFIFLSLFFSQQIKTWRVLLEWNIIAELQQQEAI